MDFGEVHIGRYVTKTVHAFRKGVPVLGGEGASVSRCLVMESFGRVVVQGGLHVGDPGVEGSGGERWSSDTGGIEHGVADMGHMLVQQQLVPGMASNDGLIRTKLFLPAS